MLSSLRGCSLVLVAVAMVGQAIALEGVPQPSCADHNPNRNAYFGDLHVHTGFSFDAVIVGTSATPEDAYNFAKGEPLVLAPTGPRRSGLPRTRQLDRPLDFTAVTEHAEFLGELAICFTPPADADDPNAPYNSQICEDSRLTAETAADTRLDFDDPDFAIDTFQEVSQGTLTPTPERNEEICGDGDVCEIEAAIVWQEIQDMTNEANEPCRFTALHGYEWTGSPFGSNLHRNVIFKNADVPSAPISYFEAPRPQQLWFGLTKQCIKGLSSCDAISIPHGSNSSSGVMFSPTTGIPGATQRGARPITAREARTRASFETLVEIIQHKGSSECRQLMEADDGTGLFINDEQCAFEQIPRAFFFLDPVPNKPFPRLSFAREGLKEGLTEFERTGVNPFKFGFIGSTDTHNATPGQVSDEEFATTGHIGGNDYEPDRNLNIRTAAAGIESNGGGLAVVWAEENTRESIFDAMKRRETYATSGSRMKVRFFGGWDYPAATCDSFDAVQAGYDGGVPMGGDLPEREARRGNGSSPSFLVTALKDAGNDRPATDLQRIQIIKAWIDRRGVPQERVFDVAGSADNGASVDTDTCRTSGQGAASLCAVWNDPDFDADRPATYYARVLENPTCRWNQTFCAATYGHVTEACSRGRVAPEHAQCCSETAAHESYCVARLDEEAEEAGLTRGRAACTLPVDSNPTDDDIYGIPQELKDSCCQSNYIAFPKTVQERAWTSPIWYTPDETRLTSGRRPLRRN